jgi:SAM-dependent methyltransferase
MRRPAPYIEPYPQTVRETYKILDVGCGGKPQGDVNLDLYDSDNPHTSQKIKPLEIPNFVIGDARHLPFQAKTFDTVVCRHTLKHLIAPAKALMDMPTTVRHRLTITVPNSPISVEHHTHLYSWTKTSLGNLLSRFCEVELIQFEPRRRGKLIQLAEQIPLFALRRLILQKISKLYRFPLIAYCKP